jgi:hypothetical protein
VSNIDAVSARQEAASALQSAKEGTYFNPVLTKILIDIKEVSLAGGYQLFLAADKLKPAIIAALRQKGYEVELTGNPIAFIKWFPRPVATPKPSLIDRIRRWWKELPI